MVNGTKIDGKDAKQAPKHQADQDIFAWSILGTATWDAVKREALENTSGGRRTRRSRLPYSSGVQLGPASFACMSAGVKRELDKHDFTC